MVRAILETDAASSLSPCSYLVLEELVANSV